MLVPVFDMLELTAAVRADDYSGFGTTVNPKFSAKFEPFDWLLFRGSYNTGFRVPTFNQLFNGLAISPNPGNSLADPSTCPAGGLINVTAGCNQINPDAVRGGKPTLGPETSEQYSVGVVVRPMPRWSLSADYWSIAVDDTIGALSIAELLANYTYFPNRIIRTGGIITTLDLTSDNIGSRRTKGVEISARGGFDAIGGAFNIGLDGTYLVEKKEKFLPFAPYSDIRGVFTYAGDLGLKWKHNAWINYKTGIYSFNFSQIFRSSYDNNRRPLVATTRPDYNDKVKAYVIYNAALGMDVSENFRLTAGVRNVFDKDPPFAITYDTNSGAGGSWEPRIADPRGRSFTLLAEVKF